MLRDSLVDWMPDYYTGENVAAVQEAREIELSSIEDDQERIYDDMFISSATDIGLWEAEYNVTLSGDTLEDKRNALLAYVRGGAGALTLGGLIDIIESYTGTDLNFVTESPDECMDYIYLLRGEIATVDLEGMVAAIEQKIQAHAGAKFEYRDGIVDDDGDYIVDDEGHYLCDHAPVIGVCDDDGKEIVDDDGNSIICDYKYWIR